jgi:hypothetical protein
VQRASQSRTGASGASRIEAVGRHTEPFVTLANTVGRPHGRGLLQRLGAGRPARHRGADPDRNGASAEKV